MSCAEKKSGAFPGKLSMFIHGEFSWSNLPEGARPGLPHLQPAVGAPDDNKPVAAVEAPHGRRHRFRGRSEAALFVVVGVAAAPIVWQN